MPVSSREPTVVSTQEHSTNSNDVGTAPGVSSPEESVTSPDGTGAHLTSSGSGSASVSSSTGENTRASSEDGEEDDDQALAAQGIHKQGDWQAVWSPDHNAYYFYNSSTNETTWTNPLSASTSTSTPTVPEPQPLTQMNNIAAGNHDFIAAAIAAGVDPELAYLDPSLVYGPNAPGAGSFTAKFNARTGAFAKPEARDPTHLGEWERAQRMSSVYFDTAAYEREVQKRKEEEEANGKKKKKVTKKDLVC
jgi:hypothetical protein